MQPMVKSRSAKLPMSTIRWPARNVRPTNAAALAMLSASSPSPRPAAPPRPRVGRLPPTPPGRLESGVPLDDRQRRRDDLHVEDRHEHADAHRREAEPGAYQDAAFSVCQETNHAKSMDRKQSTARPGKVLTMEVGLGRFDRAKISVCISVHVWLPS